MALLSMRKFAKVTGISYYNIKKYIEDGVIKADENGMLESSESIRILRKELKEGIKHYAVFLSSSPLVKAGIKELMNKENAVEVKSYDSIIIEYNKSLTDKSVGVSESISRKYKEAVLEEFVKRYKACVNRQIAIAYENTEMSVIPYPETKELLAVGKFPEGYKHLEGANINSYVTQGIERFLLKLNNMQKKFDKICEDLLLYWDSADDKTVFTRADITPELME